METDATEILQDPSTEILDELARAYEEIHLLHGLAGAIEDELEHRMVFAKIIGCLKELLPVEAAEIWTFNQQEGEYHCALQWDGAHVTSRLDVVAHSPLLEAQIHGMGVRVLRGQHSVRDSIDTFLLEILSGMGFPAVVAPLCSKAKLLGILVVKIPASLETLSSSRLRLVEAAARQTCVSMQVDFLVRELRANERLKKEVEIARQIQHGLLPEKIPQRPHFDLYAGCVTAARVGGDYYDFIERKDRLGLLIADVAGHSIASALIAMSFRTTFRFYLARDPDQGDLFRWVNDALNEELSKSGTFLSAFYGIFDETTRVFRYVNAGHNPPILWRKSEQRFLRLEESGLLIGILPDQEYVAAEVYLAPGDVLLLYTDGIVEAENQGGDFFGIERLEEAVRKNLSRSSREMYHYLLKEMYIFQDEQFSKDDVTLLILKVLETQ